MSDEPTQDLAQPDGQWRIKPLHQPDEAPAVPIPPIGMTIGRADSNDLVLGSVDFPSVSGTHVRVVLRDGLVWVEDLGSKNGTLVGGTPVQRVSLGHGDVFELGKGGPRFVVLSPTQADQTVVMPKVSPGPRREMGAETVELVREKLGIPAHTKVTDVVRGENRRNTILLVMVLMVLIAGGVYGVRKLQDTSGEVAALKKTIDEQMAAASTQFHSHKAAWEKRAAEIEATYKLANEETRKELEKERDRIKKQIDARGSAVEVARLRKQLEETQGRLKSLDPVALAQIRLQTVNKVGRSVVLLEIRQTFIEPKTKRKLYLDRGGSGPNLNQKGDLWEQESTGSGFVISHEGWILTNAHVVLKKGGNETLRLSKDLVLDSVVDIHVVFSGSDRRIRGTLKDWANKGTEDLALVKIAPFPGMPFLGAGIDVKRARPDLGTPVYLLGFPFGNRALQDGKKVIASAFRGIVSREVHAFLQVDAAVHAGNSGGPVINENGAILGVVVGMQRIDAKLSASDMGYIIPIDRAAVLWPYKAGRKR